MNTTPEVQEIRAAFTGVLIALQENEKARALADVRAATARVATARKTLRKLRASLQKVPTNWLA